LCDIVLELPRSFCKLTLLVGERLGIGLAGGLTLQSLLLLNEPVHLLEDFGHAGLFVWQLLRVAAEQQL
jgi:hypothetical protein